MDKKLRAYYIRQLRKLGYSGNPGGWVFSPNGVRIGQGWDIMLRHLGGQLHNFGRHLGGRLGEV